MANPRMAKLANLTRTTNGCFTAIATINNVTHHSHLRNLPVVRLLYGEKTREPCKHRCLCRKSSDHSQHHLPCSRLILIVQKEPRSKLPRDLSQILSASHVFQMSLGQLTMHIRCQAFQPGFVHHPIRPSRNRSQWDHSSCKS